MGQYEIKNLFFENPTRDFHIREIARILGISKTVVGYHVKELIAEHLVVTKDDVFRKYRAHESSKDYRFAKLLFALEKVHKSGIIKYLEQQMAPKTIILFGSFAKAEFTTESDIDLFVQAADIHIDLQEYEKRLGHHISLFCEPEIKNLSTELFTNIINGIKLSGHLKTHERDNGIRDMQSRASQKSRS